MGIDFTELRNKLSFLDGISDSLLSMLFEHSEEENFNCCFIYNNLTKTEETLFFEQKQLHTELTDEDIAARCINLQAKNAEHLQAFLTNYKVSVSDMDTYLGLSPEERNQLNSEINTLKIAELKDKVVSGFAGLRQFLKGKNYKYNLGLSTVEKRNYLPHVFYNFKGVQVLVQMKRVNDRLPVYFTSDGVAYTIVAVARDFLNSINYYDWAIYQELIKSQNNQFLLQDVSNVYGPSLYPNLLILGKIIYDEETGTEVFGTTLEAQELIDESCFDAIGEVCWALRDYDALFSDYIHLIGKHRFFNHEDLTSKVRGVVVRPEDVVKPRRGRKPGKLAKKAK